MQKFVNNGLLFGGAIIILVLDVAMMLMPEARELLASFRFLGTMLFILGIMIRLISLEHRTEIAFGQHERMFDEIHKLKRVNDFPEDHYKI